MTSTWRERPSHDAANPEGDGSDLLSRDAAEGFSSDQAEPEAARDFIDRGMSDAQDLHRLEESIRWLMNAGTGPGPRPTQPGTGGPMVPARPTAGLPGTGLRLLEGDDNTLRLDPDTLFVPQRRRSSLAASVAKVVVVSAIAAPTAYFIANWLQAPATPAASDPLVVAAPLVLPDDQADTRIPATAPDDTATPQGRPVGVTTVATAPEAVTPEPPAVQPRVVPPAADVPPTTAAAQPAAAPARPPLTPQEAAKMVERGNILFNAGDIVSARLLFRRAADAGNASGATALAMTFDADVLAKQMLGSAADPEEAQRWYARARELGERDTGMVALH